MPTPQQIQPRQPDLVRASRLPESRDVVDPDELAGVEYGHEHEIAGNIQTIVDELKERLGYVPPLIPEQHTVEP